MSSTMYRSNIARIRKEIADLDKRASAEAAKVASYERDIGQIQRSITASTSPATLRSKQQQIENKRRPLVQAQKRYADLQSQSARKLQDLNRQLENLARVEKQESYRQEQERKRQEQDDKRRRQEELRHSQQLTRDLEARARITAQLAQHEFVIDLAALPRKITVLFLASNPRDQGHLRLDEEARAISTKIRAAEYRDSVELRTAWAVRPGDIFQALNEHKPHVVHFSGHGSASGELVFQDEAGGTKLVSSEAIVATIATVADHVSLVVLNSCFSAPQAAAITKHVDFAIGMTDSIGDEAARVFAAHFYSAIGFGLSIQQAFDQACVALMLDGIPEDEIPQLYSGEDQDPKAAILVRPLAVEEDDSLDVQSASA